MLTLKAGETRLLPNEREKLCIIKQIKPLVDEGINILIDDGILPYHEIDELSFRIKEYLAHTYDWGGARPKVYHKKNPKK